MVSETVSTALRLSGEARRTAIIDAVLGLSAERSPGLITTSDIAGALGLSQGAIFKHFPSKEDIWLAVAERVASSLLMTIERVAAQANSPLAGLRAIFLAHVGFVIERPGAPRFIFHELQRAIDSPVKLRLRGMLADYRQLLMHLLAEAAQHGQVDENINHAAAVSLLIGSIQGLVMQSMVADSQLAMLEQAEAVLAIIERGITRQARGNAA